MKAIRWWTLIGALLLLFISVLLLLNFTAANPTGRRYSSEIPRIGQQYSINEVGADGERILANDLGLPNNNDSQQRQCVCGLQYDASSPSQCNTCVAFANQIANFRIPDFVAPGFIAESKNARQLSLSQGRDFLQISEIAMAARAAGLAFWIYVRVDTVVDPAYEALFEGVDGGIVPYFAVPGYVDPVDALARFGLILALALLLVLLLWTGLERITSDRSGSRQPPRDPFGKADEAGDFARRMKDRAQQIIDIEDGTNGNH